MGQFFCLVDTPGHREDFKRHYRIPKNVSIVHYRLGEWHEKRPTEAVVISMIAFIEGGMRIPMGRVTRDFLTLFRLCPTLCSPNMFRVLGRLDAMNEKIGINLTYHDINWIYSCQKNNEANYYLKLGFLLLDWFLVSPRQIKAWTRTFLLFLGNGMMDLIAQPQMAFQVG